MKFNYHAVGKKARIKKTLLLATPISFGVAIVGAFVINLSKTLGFNIFYYLAVMSIGYIVGYVVRKIGRGTTNEFLYIAGIMAFLAISLAIYLSFVFSGYNMPIDYFLFEYLLAIPSVANDFSILVIGFGVAVAVFQANTVQLR